MGTETSIMADAAAVATLTELGVNLGMILGFLAGILLATLVVKEFNRL